MIHAWAGDNIWIELAIRGLIAATVFLPAISLVAMFSIWWERKVAGHMQSRLGPMHVGGWHGWAQSLADGIKLILKEDLVPKSADGLLFRMAPYLAFPPIFVAFLAIPFGPQLVFEQAFNIGVLYLLAVLALEVMSTILAGWASNSKWSVYGAMREACQMVSYEVPLGISIITAVITAGTLHMMELNYLQGKGIWSWFVFHNPFMLGTFLVFFTATLASNKRAPFDLPESESELVAGFHTEYSGLRWSFFFFAEYGAMFVVGCITTMLFLGGWNSPLGLYDPVHRLLGYDPIVAGAAYFNGSISAAVSFNAKAQAINVTGALLHPTSYQASLTGVGLILVNVYCLGWFLLKTFTMIFIQMWLRWTLPRIRIDQVLHACVKVLLPVSLILLAGAAAWVAIVQQPQPTKLALLDGQTTEIIRLGHLMSPTPMVQKFARWTLTLLGVGFVLWMISIVVVAFIRRDQQPRKTFFPDIMPVGNQVAFTPGTPEESGLEAEATG